MVHSWIAVFCCLSLLAQTQAGPIVATEYGSIEGFTYTTPDNFEAEVFLGIPYAAAPIGNLRFEKPQPPAPWSGTLNATVQGAPCATIPTYDKPGASEDCLFMNIIKPAAPSTSPEGYPVLIYLHGGGYLAGAATDKPYTEIAANLVSQGVVFVSLNFRLAAFGYFSTGNSEAPGNYGVWDQLEAMKFVQKVIPQFGGRADNVTVMGHSAGSKALSRLIVSPLAKDLFHRAILMSGPSMTISDSTVEYSRNLTDVLACSGAGSIKACLQSKTTSEIQNGMGSIIKYLVNGDKLASGTFEPRVDGELITASNLREAIQDAPQREIFMGVTSNEYIPYTVSSSSSTNPNARYFPILPARTANYSRQDFEDFVENFLGPAFGSNATAASQRIIEFYESQAYPTGNFYLQIFGQLLSDLTFNIPFLREAKLRAKAGSYVNVYMYDFVPQYYADKYPWLSGAAHTSDQYNLFGGPVPLEGDAGQVQQTYSDLWLSFVKTGIPASGNLVLSPLGINDEEIKHVVIKPNAEIKNDLWSQRLQFWDKLAEDFGYDLPEDRSVPITSTFIDNDD